MPLQPQTTQTPIVANAVFAPHITIPSRINSQTKKLETGVNIHLRGAFAEDVTEGEGANQDSVDVVSENINSISDDLGSVSENVSVIYDNTGAMSISMNAISSSMDVMSGNMDNMSSSMDAVSSNMSIVSNNVDAMSGDMDTMNSNISAMSGNMDTMNSNMSSMSGNMDSMSSSVGSMSSSVSDMSGNVSDMSGNVSTLMDRITDKLFAGITSFADWLRAFAGMGTPDPTAIGEIRSDGAASYNPSTDSLEANSISYTTGPGNDPDTIIITSNNRAVLGAAVWITTDLAGTIIIAGVLYTNANGEVTFMLTEGQTYYLWAQKTGIRPISGKMFTAVKD